MTEYDPNISRAQNLVKLFIPVRSKDIKSTIPKLAQNSDCEVSKRLQIKQINAFSKSYLILFGGLKISFLYLANLRHIEQAFS